MAEYKNQHIIPQTYLRKWSTNGKSVESILKKNGKHIQGDPISNMFSKDYLYSMKLDDPWLPQEAIQDIFKVFDEYTVFHRGNRVTGAEAMYGIWEEFDSWEIKDRHDVKQDNSLMKKEIENKRSQIIENAWRLEFENLWDEDLKLFEISVENHIKHKNVETANVCYEKLESIVEFMIMLYYRSENIETPIDEILDVIKGFIDTDEYAEFCRVQKNRQFLKYLKNDEDSIAIHSKLLYEKSSFILFIASEGQRFRTSDTPSFIINGIKGYRSFLFPITPQYCLYAEPDGCNTFAAIVASGENMIWINNAVEKKARDKYLI